MHLNAEALIGATLHPVNLLDLILIENVLMSMLHHLLLRVKASTLHCNLLVWNVLDNIVKLVQILRSLELLLWSV